MTNVNGKTKYRPGTNEYHLHRKLGGGKPVRAEVWKSRYLAVPWVAVLWVHGESRKDWFTTHAAAVEWASQQIELITWALREINAGQVPHE